MSDDTPKTPAPADVQLGHLRRAALSFGEFLESYPDLAAAGAGRLTRDLAAKGDWLAGCCAAVDDLCCRARQNSDLPSDWQPRAELRVGDLAGVPVPGTYADPRVTAGGGAAATAGWNLAAGKESTEWAVHWGSDSLNDGIGKVELYDDEEDAREHVQFYATGRVVRRTVISLPWEAVQAGGDLPADPVSLLKRALALHDEHYTDGTPEAEAWAGETRRYLAEACSDSDPFGEAPF